MVCFVRVFDCYICCLVRKCLNDIDNRANYVHFSNEICACFKKTKYLVGRAYVLPSGSCGVVKWI